MPATLCGFAEDLRTLISESSPQALLESWDRLGLEKKGVEVLGLARRGYGAEAVLAELDGLLQIAMGHVTEIGRLSGAAAARLRTFRYAELDRWQCATAAALVDRRFGRAGLHWLVEDRVAPAARRYYAMLSLAEQRPRDERVFFTRYLDVRQHHALIATAAEALRHYRCLESAEALVRFFWRTQQRSWMRRFIGPRILQSLFTLEHPACMPLVRYLLVFGHTDSDPATCEVTRALGLLYRLNGSIAANSKYADADSTLTATLAAVRVYDELRTTFLPVAII